MWTALRMRYHFFFHFKKKKLCVIFHSTITFFAATLERKNMLRDGCCVVVLPCWKPQNGMCLPRHRGKVYLCACTHSHKHTHIQQKRLPMNSRHCAALQQNRTTNAIINQFNYNENESFERSNPLVALIVIHGIWESCMEMSRRTKNFDSFCCSLLIFYIIVKNHPSNRSNNWVKSACDMFCSTNRPI